MRQRGQLFYRRPRGIPSGLPREERAVTTQKQTLVDAYNWLPDKFWKALEAGEHYEYGSDQACDPYADTIFMYNADNETWSQATTHSEYHARDGQMLLVSFTDYECGDSDPHKEWVLTDEDSAMAAENEMYEEFQSARKRSIKRYYRWVMEHGKDPLNAFTVNPVRKRKRKFQVMVQKEDVYGRWVSWRRTRGPWREPRFAPYFLHEHLMVVDSDLFAGHFIIGSATDDLMYWGDILKLRAADDIRWLKVPSDHYYAFKAVAFEVELEEDVPVRSYPVMIRTLALAALEEME
jgi:hypothetical protein